MGGDRPTRLVGPGNDMGVKSRGSLSGGEEEPTQRAGPCLEEVLRRVGLDDLAAVDGELHAIASMYEFNYYIATFKEPNGIEVGILLFVGGDCMEVRGVAVKGCGGSVGRLVALADKPEFVVVDVEADCVTIRAPADTLFRVVRALELAGLSRDSYLASVRPLEELVEVEEEWFSIHHDSV
ncbi:MAG: hypothetical protein LRS46_03540 [Desulfurococcales archaeon]|nr:hypothetical protein [Desulfurococcales archaeon]